MFAPTPFSVSVVLFCNSYNFTNLSLWTFFSLRQSLCAYFICLTVFKLYFTFCESALSNFLSVFQLSLLDFLYLSVVCLFSASFVACICHLNLSFFLSLYFLYLPLCVTATFLYLYFLHILLRVSVVLFAFLSFRVSYFSLSHPRRRLSKSKRSFWSYPLQRLISLTL